MCEGCKISGVLFLFYLFTRYTFEDGDCVFGVCVALFSKKKKKNRTWYLIKINSTN